MSARRPGDGGRVWHTGPDEGQVVGDLHALLAGYDYERKTGHGAAIHAWTARPGLAGRTAPQQTQIDAELEELGILDPPETFLLDPDGDTVLLGRLSYREAENGESIFQQIVAVFRLCRKHGLRPYKVIAATNNSGRRPYSGRVDFDELRDVDIRNGRCRHLAALSIDRLARKASPVTRLTDMLEETGTNLYLCEFAGQVDFQSQELEINLRTMIAAEHAKRIYENTHRALINIYPARGLGWPGCRPFGFRRNKAARRLEVDPEQWPFVKIIHYEYGQYRDGRKLGLRPLQKQLKDAGCELSFSQIRNILRNRMYVDGNYTVKVNKEPIAQEPVRLDDPIPAAIFDRNQRALPVHRGLNSVTPVGYYVLNYVDMFHAGCMGKRGPGGKRIRIRGAFLRDGVPGPYAHRHGGKLCPKWKVTREDLDRAVMGALRTLASCTEIQEAWAKRTREESAPLNPQIYDRHAVRELATKLARLEELIDRESAPYVDALLEGEEPDREDHARRLDPLIKRRKLYERQLDVAKALAAGYQSDRVPLEDVPADTALEALTAILTDDPPEEEDARIRRAAAVRSMLSMIVLHDIEGGIEVELIGPLVPPGHEKLGLPLQAAGSQIRDHIDAGKAQACRGGSLGNGLASGQANASEPVSDNAAAADGAAPDTVQQPLSYCTVSADRWLEAVRSAHGRQPQGRSGPAACLLDRRPVAVDLIPAWRSPRLAIRSDGAGQQTCWTLAACLRTVIEYVASLDDADQVYPKLWNRVALRSEELPSHSVIRRVLREANTSETWFWAQANRHGSRLRRLRARAEHVMRQERGTWHVDLSVGPKLGEQGPAPRTRTAAAHASWTCSEGAHTESIQPRRAWILPSGSPIGRLRDPTEADIAALPLCDGEVAQVVAAYRELPHRLRHVLTVRLGLGVPPQEILQIAKSLGVSRSCMDRARASALDQLVQTALGDQDTRAQKLSSRKLVVDVLLRLGI